MIKYDDILNALDGLKQEYLMDLSDKTYIVLSGYDEVALFEEYLEGTNYFEIHPEQEDKDIEDILNEHKSSGYLRTVKLPHDIIFIWD